MSQQPAIRFVIGGVQKGGTTALAQFLGRHPRIALPLQKEAHVFDAPDFDDTWEAEEVNNRYALQFGSVKSDTLLGDATPIYCFHPCFVERIARYNPAMRWVLVLRDPVERAVSHYWMERKRGNESWPLWTALLLERWRLAGHVDDFSLSSPLRRHSYLARGDYARQLDVIYAHFPRDQVLLLRNEALAVDPATTVDQVLHFLGLGPLDSRDSNYPRVFAGHYTPLPRLGWRYRLMAMLLAGPMARARERYGLEWS